MSARGKKALAEKVHDRRAEDLPINSRVAIAIVADPYSKTSEQITVIRSVRDDPLAGMLSRQQIDEAQYQAGRKWQRLHECSTIGSIQAIDPAKEAVDGGRMRDPITDRQMKAFRELDEAYRELGATLSGVLFAILAERETIGQVAARLGAKNDYQIRLVGARFRGALEELAILWGFAGRKR